MMNHTTPRSDVKRTAFTPKKSASIATSFSFGLLSTALLLTSLSAQDTSGQLVSASKAGSPSHILQSGTLAGIPAWARGEDGQLVPAHDEHVTPSTPPPPGLYVALGDSITYGYGVAENCHAFPAHPVDIDSYCPDGTSYAILTAKALRKAGVAGHFMNLGINGATVERVIADELPYLPADTTLITLYVGTNDSRAVRNPENSIASVVQKYESHYQKLLQLIHERAPQARIVLINFPNQKYLAAGYHVAEDVLPRYDQISQILASFIDEHYPNYAVVDTICNPASYDQKLLYRATVHPNEAGSEILARAVTEVILAKHPLDPPASCTWYNRAAVTGP